jgi:hypothetical protein
MVKALYADERAHMQNIIMIVVGPLVTGGKYLTKGEGEHPIHPLITDTHHSQAASLQSRQEASYSGTQEKDDIMDSTLITSNCHATRAA